MALIERRTRNRIEITLPVDVDSKVGKFSGSLVNLSSGGAGIVSSHFLGEVGATLTLTLKASKNVEITVAGEIVRMTQKNNEHFYGLVFDVREQALQKRLVHLIQTLAHAEGGGKRKHPRLATRVAVECTHPKALSAILENISLGGVALTTSENAEVNEKIDVIIPIGDRGESLAVQGTVVHKDTQNVQDEVLYRLGISFDPLPTHTLQKIESFIRNLLARI